MAKSRKKDEMAVRRVTKNEQRKRPSIFTSLKDGEKLIGYALFEPDAELEKNPGFYEYFAHFDRQANQTVPCLGDQCLMCEDGHNPNTVALTLWYMPDAEKAEKFKIFRANGTLTDDLADDAADMGGLLGKKFRIKRRGQGTQTRYKSTSLNEKLPKKEINALLKEATTGENAIDLEAIVAKNAKVQLERLKAVRALEEDDDDLVEVDDDDEDEDEDEPKARRGQEVDDEDEEEEDDEEEDEEEDEDEDDEEEDEDEDEDEEEESEDEGNSTLESHSVKIAKVDEEEETFEVQDQDSDLGKFTLFLPEGMELDFDDYAKGDVLKIDAVQDDEGDWILTAEPEKQKAKGGKSKSKAKK